MSLPNYLCCVISVLSHMVVVFWQDIYEHILERNLFLVVSVPSHLVSWGIWRATEEPILVRNFFLVISVPSHLIKEPIWRPTEEPILEKNLFFVISVPGHFLTVAIWSSTKEPVLVRNYFHVIRVLNHLIKVPFGISTKEPILGGKTFSFDQCNNSFSCVSNLKTHRETHSGEPILVTSVPNHFVVVAIWRSTEEPILE